MEDKGKRNTKTRRRVEVGAAEKSRRSEEERGVGSQIRRTLEETMGGEGGRGRGGTGGEEMRYAGLTLIRSPSYISPGLACQSMLSITLRENGHQEEAQSRERRKTSRNKRRAAGGGAEG